MTSTPAAAAPEAPVDAGRDVPPTMQMTWEEFLAWAFAPSADEKLRVEWVDGELVPMSPVSLEHQLLVGFLYRLLIRFVEAENLGQVLIAPFLMRLATRPSGREPDVLFVSNEHADRLKATYLDGPADLAIEIVSPGSDAQDRGEKFVEYEGAGIPEYWVVDPVRREAIFNRLGEDGRYHPGPIDADGVYESTALPGFRLRVGWLWERPLPSIAEVAAQVGA